MPRTYPRPIRSECWVLGQKGVLEETPLHDSHAVGFGNSLEELKHFQLLAVTADENHGTLACKFVLWFSLSDDVGTCFYMQSCILMGT